jgi:type IV secretory pathway TrbD component
MTLFRHVALVFVAVVAINMMIALRRIPRFVADRGGDAQELARFVRLAGAWLIAMFLLLEILTVATGASSVFCLLPLGRPQGAVGFISWGLWIGWTLGVTLWVVVGRGAEILARFGPVFAKQYTSSTSYSARAVRWLAIVWCIGTLAAPLLMPMRPSDLGCAAEAQHEGVGARLAPSISTRLRLLEPPDQSLRSASTGSMRAARRAGA